MILEIIIFLIIAPITATVISALEDYYDLPYHKYLDTIYYFFFISSLFTVGMIYIIYAIFYKLRNIIHRQPKDDSTNNSPVQIP
jgi:uncharacterized membrane protein